MTGGKDDAPAQPAAVEVHAGRDAYVAQHMQVHHPQPESVVPRQLPVAARHFAGRTAELETLTGLLHDAAEAGGTVVISAIDGTAGIGKTALAVSWAHRVADRFPDGQLFVNLRGFDPTGSPVKPMEAVRGFLDAFAVPVERIPASLDTQAALYRSLVAGKRMLVVLDNARDAEQVRPLLPGAPTCLVVVTSRNQLTSLVASEGAYPLTLDLLTADEARELLVRRLGAHQVAEEPQAVDNIIALCARLPLALVIVAARAATHPAFPLTTLAAELHNAGARLDALDAGDPTTNMRAVFSWSYKTLAPDAASLFRLLGLHPGPDVSAAAAASLAALPLSGVSPLLAELTWANLLVEHSPGRYTFHDLLRAYAAELSQRIDPDGQRRAATDRMLDHYLHTAHTAALLLNPARDPITLTPPPPGTAPEHPTDHGQALEWFTAEHTVLLAAVDHAATGWSTHTWQLAWTVYDFLDWRGHWHDLAATGRAALAAARRLADPTAQARAHRHLTGAYTQLGRFDDAHTQLRQALNLYRQAGDLAGQAHTHMHLANVWERQGRHSEALDHAQQAFNLHQAAGHRRGQANALNMVGWLHARLDDHRQALTACEQALTMLQELEDRNGQAETWDSLGYAHHHLGHHTQAITCYQHAVDLFRDLGNRYEEAATLTHLGDTHHAAANPAAAHDAWQRALTILDQLDHPDADQVHTKLTALNTPPAATAADPPERAT
jgi:tetratricopeptide (TPR) repeat protein